MRLAVTEANLPEGSSVCMSIEFLTSTHGKENISSEQWNGMIHQAADLLQEKNFLRVWTKWKKTRKIQLPDKK